MLLHNQTNSVNETKEEQQKTKETVSKTKRKEEEKKLMAKLRKI